jgi:hypothetical protein
MDSTFMAVIKTDQRTCFDENGNRIPCEGTGQDGETQCGKKWPIPRYIENRNVVKDKLSGLTWTQNTNIFNFPVTWSEARSQIEKMNRSRRFGYNDWRLPLRNELFDILSHANINPAFPDPSPFTNAFAGYYWTGTPCARLSDQFWYIHLGGARVQRGIMDRSYLVWPVRGKNGLQVNITAEKRFQITGDTVFDLMTGLEWIKDADVMGKSVNWTDALEGAKELNRSKTYGCSDWRIPNIRELNSLVDLNRFSPALSYKHPFFNLRQAYWSGTTSVYEPRYAWVVEFKDGALGVGFKPLQEFNVWYVRGNCQAPMTGN